MTTATVIRALAPSEEIFAPGEVYVGYSVRVSGRLDLGALSAAFDAVVRAHPILGARLEPSGESFVLLEPAGAPPEIAVTDGDPELLLTGAAPDQRTALSGLCVVRDGDTASVTLLTHHCVADAYHSLSVLRELWAYYTGLTQHRVPDLPEHGYPQPVEELLAARDITKVPNPMAAPPRAPGEKTTGNPDSHRYRPQRTTRCHLTVEQTTALIELGHREHVTINALASAAILLTEAEIRNLPLSELLYTYSVDLRSRLSPKVGFSGGTNVIGFASYAPTALTSITMLGLAHGVHDTLRVGLATGFVQQTPLHIPDIAAAGPPRIPGIVLATNWGRVAAPMMPPGLRVTDFRSTMIAKPDRTGRRPEKPDEGTCIISGFLDRLSIEIHHPESNTHQHQRRVRLLTRHLLAPLAATN
ncbi:hypothetical protein [Nocardia sp. NPDC052566]|uniref:phthiocerol/phthiodiolone dimycocerosyl transferase family protein n=1 Tax=Nocardia sp. NPDC052566 TaxID=3364330 RepID=UPI0037CB95B5